MSTKIRIKDIGKTLSYKNGDSLVCIDYKYSSQKDRYFTFKKPDGDKKTISYRHVIRLIKEKKAKFILEKNNEH
jgi:hypothetical protein